MLWRFAALFSGSPLKSVMSTAILIPNSAVFEENFPVKVVLVAGFSLSELKSLFTSHTSLMHTHTHTYTSCIETVGLKQFQFHLLMYHECIKIFETTQFNSYRSANWAVGSRSCWRFAFRSTIDSTVGLAASSFKEICNSFNFYWLRLNEVTLGFCITCLQCPFCNSCMRCVRGTVALIWRWLPFHCGELGGMLSEMGMVQLEVI